MNIDRVTLKLDKDMSMTSFGRYTLRLGIALEDISKELTYSELHWKIDNDTPVPGTVTAVGVGDPKRVSEVVRKYSRIIADISENKPYTAGRKVQLAIDRLLSIKNPELKSIVFETCDGAWSIAPRDRGTLATVIPSDDREAAGTNTTQASTIDAIRGILMCHAFIKDEISDHLVRYLEPFEDQWIREHLGKEVIAVGEVYRSPAKALPSRLTNILSVADVPLR